MESYSEIEPCSICGSFGCCCGCYVGTNLEARIPMIFKSKRCNCESTRDGLNSLTPEQVESRFSEYAGILVQNAKKYAIPEGLSRPKAEKWLRESIDQAKEALKNRESKQRSVISEIRGGMGMSRMSKRNMRLQRGQQELPPQDGNLPR